MFSLVNKKLFCYSERQPRLGILRFQARSFGPNERQKERIYNQSHNKYHIKDFTKHQDF